MVFRTGQVLVDPSHAELAELLGASTRPQPAATTWPSSAPVRPGWPPPSRRPPRGCGPWWWNRRSFGGQAGTSSLIRNYPGFPHGISGDDLAFRTFEQAWLFGTSFVFAQAVTGLASRGPERLLHLTDGTTVTARAVILATGVTWRRLGVPSLEALAGSGVFYGAAGSEAQATQGQRCSWSEAATRPARPRSIWPSTPRR